VMKDDVELTGLGTAADNSFSRCADAARGFVIRPTLSAKAMINRTLNRLHLCVPATQIHRLFRTVAPKSAVGPAPSERQETSYD
jgi:hypothetical protein